MITSYKHKARGVPGRLWRATLSLAAFAALWACPLQAQTSASLSGTVQDPSGAAIPGATVLIQNQATKDTRTTTTNGAGFFTAASLGAATYNVTITAPGFTSWQRNDVSLNAGDARTLTNINLQLGQSSTAVTVSADVAEVPVDNGTRSSLISSQEIERLSTIGRDATELLGILPGMSVASSGGVSLSNTSGYNATVTGIGNTAIGNFTSNGGEPNGSTQTFLDGASIIDPGNMGAGTQTLDMDMVSQVNVQTSAFGANSPGGPTIINAVSKAGTSAFHGEGYLYARNQFFNSNSWGDNNTGTPKPSGSYYYPGGNIGGPILIPHTNFNKNKSLLFFVGYENYQQTFPGPLLETVVPTTGMRSGDFSPASLASICPTGSNAAYCSAITGAYSGLSGPQTALNGSPITLPSGTPITGNVIPTSAFDPGGAAIMKFIPAPNATYSAASPYNYVRQLNYYQNGWLFNGRIDYSLGNNDKFFFTYNQQGEQDINDVNEYWNPPNSIAYPSAITANDTSRTMVLNYVHIFGASLTNEAVATDSYFIQPWALSDPTAVSKSTYGYPYSGYFKNSSFQMPALLDWSNYGYPMSYMEGGFENGSVLAKKQTPTFADNLTWVKSTHTMAFGYYFMHSQNKQTSTGQWSQGALTFGNAGSWMTSGSDVYPGTGNPVANLLLGLPSAYTQSNYIPVTDLFYRVNAFYLQDSWKVKPRLTVNYGVRLEHIGPWLNAYPGGMAIFDPALYTNTAVSGQYPGLTWHGINPSVPSSGIYNYPWAFVSPRAGIAWDIFGNGHTVLRGGWGRYRYQDQYNEWAGPVTETQGQVTASNPSPQTLGQINNYVFSGNTPLTPGSLGTVFTVDPKDNTRPFNDNYNVTISQRGPKNSVMEFAYVGSRTRFMNNTENYLASNNNYALANVNLIGMGALFNPDPITGAAPNPAGALTADYRPYPLYTTIAEINNNLWSNYNAFQASWAKQTGKLTWQLGYTFSKVLGINSANDPFNYSNDYGVMGFDRTHVFNSAYSYDSGQWLHKSGWYSGVVNGWLISGITTIQSGVPVNGAANTNYSISGLGTYNVSSQTILGTPDVALVPLMTCSPTSNLGKNQYINGNCFTVPGAGNGTYEDPYISSPAFARSDLSLQKNIKIRESQTIQLRFSAFNFLNHSLWTFNPNNNSDIVLQFPTPAAGARAVNANQQFGVLNYKASPLGASAPTRVVEFTLKYMF